MLLLIICSNCTLYTRSVDCVIAWDFHQTLQLKRINWRTRCSQDKQWVLQAWFSHFSDGGLTSAELATSPPVALWESGWWSLKRKTETAPRLLQARTRKWRLIFLLYRDVKRRAARAIQHQWTSTFWTDSKPSDNKWTQTALCICLIKSYSCCVVHVSCFAREKSQ